MYVIYSFIVAKITNWLSRKVDEMWQNHGKSVTLTTISIFH